MIDTIANSIWFAVMVCWSMFITICLWSLFHKLLKDWFRFVYYVITFRFSFFTAVYNITIIDKNLANKADRYELKKDMDELVKKYKNKS